MAETPHLQTAAAWLHAEWWQRAGYTLEATAAWLRAARGPSAPIAFLAEIDQAPAGTALLDTDDLDTRMDLTQWLASVLVAPAFRGRGVGRALAAHVAAAARARGFRELWAHTSTALGYWRRFGFAVAGEEVWAGAPTTLLRLDLSAAPFPP